MRIARLSECVRFNVPLDAEYVISETSLSTQLIALVLTTKNKETKHYIHQKHKTQTGKNALANRTIKPWFGYGFYDLWPGNGAGPILTAHSPHRAKITRKVFT